MRCLALNAKSPEIALTMSWQSSNTPRTAMLKMLASCSEYIWAAWNALMRPCGESMKTCTFFLPRRAYSADDPVSPEVRSEEHTSELQSHRDLHSFPTRRSSDLRLERAHAALRRKHEDLHVLLAAQGVLGGRSGVPGGGADHVDPPAVLVQRVLEEIAEELERDVLEGERRPVGEAEEIDTRLELFDRGDIVAAEDLFRVSRIDEPLQVARGNVVGEPRQDRERQLRVAHAAHRGKIGGTEFRKFLGQIQAAVGREALEQDLGERLRFRPAAGADVTHGISAAPNPGHCSSSSRILVTFPVTTFSFSILPIAVLMLFSRVWWVSMMMSTCSSPSAGSRCTMASMEIEPSARMRVMSASTPGRSSTRMRR